MSSPASRPVPIASPSSSPRKRNRSSLEPSEARSASNARLASPVRSSSFKDIPRARDDPTIGTRSPLPGSSDNNQSQGPGQSALAAALSGSSRRPSSPQLLPPAKPPVDGAAPSGADYGSFGAASLQSRLGRQSPRPQEDFEVVKRHLVSPKRRSPSPQDGIIKRGHDEDKSDEQLKRVAEDDEFSSLKLQGGDITREIYKRTEAETVARRHKPQRSRSLHVPRDEPSDEELDIGSIRQPGGFRRNHIRRTAQSPARSNGGQGSKVGQEVQQPPGFVTRNFFEFLSLYGHFAGEDVDDEDWSSQYSSSRWDSVAGDERGHEADGDAETAPLLKRAQHKAQRREAAKGPKKGAAGTIFILLKSFVGTGVLFLPRAFLNGGMTFSIFVLLMVSSLSYYCFCLLTISRLKLKGSFAEMGEIVFGKPMRALINCSLVISQLGFASAYIVFTSENLQAFVLAVSNHKTYIDIKVMILMQLIIFLPLSLYRNLNNIAFIVYVADIFIVLGLIYLYYFGISTIAHHGVADIEHFNRDTWTLFIGTAIFTFEGIGLIIPIQDGMKKPQQLPWILGSVMLIITTIFLSMGAISYAAYGSKTETVLILNMPQDNRFVNAVQFIYSLAILLSTPMQIFPAITIMEKGVFQKSGKHSRNIKWQKNLFRFLVVIGSAMLAWVGADDLDKFVSLVGSFACIPLVYIYPTLIHYRGVAQSRWSKLVDIGLCCLGVVLMVYTTALTIMSWVGTVRDQGPG
ncbi:MAG: neutral amino acid transporter [Chrysothrix sp. TS-e1954]|nr:MAG: neutral amino acid transporter [Chrysothrix sp. TS-e1954]